MKASRGCETTMSEKVLGIIRVFRPAFARQIYEDLFLTPDRVIVARTSGGIGGMLFGAVGGAIEGVISAYREKKKEKGYLELPLEDVLKADKNNFAIPKSEITKVELKKFGRGAKINIITSKKKHKWYAAGLIPEKKGVKLEDYENILRPVFGDKLSVKK